MNNKNKLPELHQQFIEDSVPLLKKDSRILGVAAGGSFLLGSMDEYSDLDLVVVVDSSHFGDVMAERKTIAAGIGDLIDSFTGEHVGEPRLLICLYGPPLLHIDFKFISFDDVEEKVENPVILWERENCLTNVIYKEEATFPSPNPQWIEERFWIWIHYCATKLGRGEIFEAIDFLSYLRSSVLGPMILKHNHARPQGVRKIEQFASREQIEKLKSTIPGYNLESCKFALLNSINLYKELRTEEGNQLAETLVMQYLDTVSFQSSSWEKQT